MNKEKLINAFKSRVEQEVRDFKNNNNSYYSSTHLIAYLDGMYDLFFCLVGKYVLNISEAVQLEEWFERQEDEVNR